MIYFGPVDSCNLVWLRIKLIAMLELLQCNSFPIGAIRLAQYLSQDHLLGRERSLKFVLDAGTGTTAVGLGIGAICLRCVPL